jgi:hypothetical protein
MKDYWPWLLLAPLAAVLALSFVAGQRSSFSLETLGLAFCAVAFFVFTKRQFGKLTLQARPNSALASAAGRRRLLVSGVVAVLLSPIWMIGALLLQVNVFVATVPFAILLFGGAGLIGLWVVAKAIL